MGTKTDQSFEIRQDAMPDEMRILLNQYPREAWDAHPGFKDKTRQWLNAHQGFRRLIDLLDEDARALLDKNMAPTHYAKRLSRYGSILIGNLHGHHGWEDYEYFPELSVADPRFDHGLEILEKDHAALDVVLDAFTDIGNSALKLEKLDETKLYEKVGKLHPVIETIDAFLDRHLGDEEELAVPIILEHRLRG